MTFQILPHIHLRDQVSAPPHQSSHMRCMQDDFSNLTLHPSSVTKHTKILTQGGCEMTFQISPQHPCERYNKGKILQIFIIWPWDIKEVTSNTKFSHEVHAR